jgi:hypothetical protein
MERMPECGVSMMMTVPSARTTARWLCSALSVLLGAAWVVSMWFGVTGTWRTAGHMRTTALFAGTLCLILIDDPAGEPSVKADSWSLHGPKAFWRFQWTVHPQQTNIVIPLWIPFGASLAAAGWLWTTEICRRRRMQTSSCPCGYDRVGLAPDAPCPECGQTPSPARSSRHDHT